MMTLAELSLLQWRAPWAALLLLLPLALGWLARRRRQRLAHYADPQLWPWAFQARAPRLGGARRPLEALAWLLLALAAAGPRLPAADAVAASQAQAAPHGIDILVALDVSLSMAATDIAPDRLSRARLELSDLLRRLHGERLGLLLYGAQAGLLLPPTGDAALFERALAQAGPDLLDARGTDTARALQLARQAFAGEAAAPSGRGRAVLLVTDADAASLDGAAAEAAEQAAQALRQDGISLFVLVLASADGAPVPGRLEALSQPALAAYAQLARSGGGRLARVADGDADWQTLYDDGLARLPGEHVAPAAARAWRELFALPLGLALALLLWTRLPPAARRALPVAGWLLVLGLGALGHAPPASAAPPVEAAALPQAAAQAYRAGEWAQALPLFERQGGYAGHMGAGACAWKLLDHATAAHHFSRALLLAHSDAERDDALYNLGNAEFALGRWLSAAQAWQAVLRSRPHDGAAAANLAQARAQLAKRGGGAPMKSDLRGRRGFIAEGLVGVDGATPVDPGEPLLPGGSQDPMAGAGPAAAGARLDAAATAADLAQQALQPQRLQSGLVKLERLEDRRRQLLQGLLRQDRAASPAEGKAPW